MIIWSIYYAYMKLYDVPTNNVGGRGHIEPLTAMFQAMPYLSQNCRLNLIEVLFDPPYQP